jgi:glyoxylase-like metal-dependent hydrolase (beta-lactamase superfamily II)
MSVSTRVLAACLATLSLTAAGQAREADYPWQIEEVSTGVFAFLQPTATRLDDSNTAVILGANEVIVVDAQSDPAAVRAVIAWITATTDAPVTLVINTHWHADHTQGNVLYREAFGDAVDFIGHQSLIEDVPARAATSIQQRVEYFETELPGARERLERGVFRDGTAMTDLDEGEQRAVIIQAEAWLAANRDAAWVLPNRPYGSRQRLRRAGRTIDLIHFEGHTRGDTVVWLPEEGVAITGDLLDDLPYGGHGYPSTWRAALERLREMPIVATIPGHGRVFRDATKLEAIHGFLDKLITDVTRAAEAGQTLEATTAALDLAAWRDQIADDVMAADFFDQTLPEVIERAWLEARGEIE